MRNWRNWEFTNLDILLLRTIWRRGRNRWGLISPMGVTTHHRVLPRKEFLSEREREGPVLVRGRRRRGGDGFRRKRSGFSSVLRGRYLVKIRRSPAVFGRSRGRGDSGSWGRVAFTLLSSPFPLSNPGRNLSAKLSVRFSAGNAAFEADPPGKIIVIMGVSGAGKT